jgi:hypothetical protein
MKQAFQNACVAQPSPAVPETPTLRRRPAYGLYWSVPTVPRLPSTPGPRRTTIFENLLDR